MNQSAENLTDTEPEPHQQQAEPSNADWIGERKREFREVFENKSREISRRVQTQVSDRMSHYESALSRASESLSENEERQPAEITRELAERIHEAADYVRNSEPEAILADSADRVRSSPFIALGAAAVCGFLAGRVIASAKDDEPANA
ncbi:hypothetical protein [Pelagicoccus sp. SDUM812003]|uniref:hypothetical protein n=1 Tax=Pelagicoccus sp. SDUM812003 TaxID=3041267 RepID=UPI00280E3856|nr:hypothetical protein [Pelagicoccus sp. SDUM812003]MDQ8203985.1 hypothetical protein [Pelagicoccus sp. SDUM812003]